MQHAFIEEVIVEGMPGSNLGDSVKEVFEWMYNQRKGCAPHKCTMRGVNGFTVVITRER
jgi:hypothetical protein